MSPYLKFCQKTQSLFANRKIKCYHIRKQVKPLIESGEAGKEGAMLAHNLGESNKEYNPLPF